MMIPKLGYYAVPIHGPGDNEVNFEVLEVEVQRAGARIQQCHKAIRSYFLDEKDDKEGASE